MKFISILLLLLVVNINAFINIDLVVFSGSFIRKEKYINLAENIKTKLELENINSTIHIIDTFNKVHTLNNLIHKSKIKNKIHLIGHSGGSCEAAIFCKRVDQNKISSLIQLYADYNLEEQHPYYKTHITDIHNPSLTILAEFDDRLPFTDAILDKNSLSDKHKLIVMKDWNHFSGISTNLEDEKILSKIISDYITSIEYKDLNTVAKFNIEDLQNKVSEKYNNYLHSVKNINIYNIINNIEKNLFNYTDFDIYSNLYSKSNNMFETMFEFHNNMHKHLLYMLKYLPSFIISHPKINLEEKFITTSIFVPIKNNIMSFLYQKKITNPPLWLKLKKNDTMTENIGYNITKSILDSAINSLDEEQKIEYLNSKKPIIIGKDINIPLIPFCSILWLCHPLVLNYTSEGLIVHPTVLQTPGNVPKYFGGESVSNSLNIKTISEAQILEWILIKSKF